MHWYPVELHTHTCHSDGDFTVKELVRTAKRDGYRALALTDHNTASGVEEFCREAKKQGILPIRGLEWTTYHGHMTVLEEEGYTDWRGAGPEDIDNAIRAIHKNGGVVGIAHPFALGDPVNTGYRWEFQIKDWTQVDCLEVWSRNWAPRRIQTERAFAMWDDLLRKGFHITAVTGRDWHRDDRLPCCYTWVGMFGELTREGLLDALRQGRVCLTAGPFFTMKLFQGHREFFPGDTLSVSGRFCPGTGGPEAGTSEAGTPGTGAGEEKVRAEVLLDRDVLPGTWEKKQVVPEEICLIVNGTVRDVVPVRGKVKLDIQPEKGWARAELYGRYYETEHCRIAVTNPVYID